MLKFVLILFIGLSNVPKTISCVTEYGQCDGLDYRGPTDCCAPLVCEFNNLWYSLCWATPTEPTTSPSSTSESAEVCQNIYNQCGGQNWLGRSCCVDSICTFIDLYYSQCLPDSSSSRSTDSTSSSSFSSTATSTSSILSNSTTTSNS
ncbi:unnamed protein product, partial [Rotaria sp. Silwood2]